MVQKHSIGEAMFSIFNYVVVILIAFLCLYPMMHVLAASLSDPVQLSRHTGPLFLPLSFSVQGYSVVFKNPNIPTGYVNSVFYTVVGTAVNMFLTITAAYALSRKAFPLKRIITLGIVFTMYFGGGLIPSYLLVRGLGLYNSRWAMILPGAVSAFNLMVMRTAFQTVTPSLEESARIDGASDPVILFRILVPVIKATIAVVVLFYAVGHWNAWFNAMIYLDDRNLLPLQTLLREILISNSSGGNTITDGDAEVFLLQQVIKYATIIVATVPILCIYPFIQKYFVTGVMLGSVKE